MALINEEEEKDIENRRKEFIEDKEKQIQSIEKKIEDINKENKKRKFIKNLKIKQIYLNLSIPFILLPGLIFSGFNFAKVTPFIIDRDKYYKTWKTDIDCYGNRYETVRYEREQKENDKLYYSSGWNELEDGRFENEKRIYNVESLDNDEIFKLVKDNEVLSLEPLNDNLISTTKTKSKTKPENGVEPSIRAEIYDIDESDILVEEESQRRNEKSSLTYLGTVCVSELILYKAYSKSEAFKYNKKEIDDLEEQYKPITDDKLKKKLRILKENLNILTRR